MVRVLLLTALVAIIAAVGIGFTVGFNSTDFLSAGSPAVEVELPGVTTNDVGADAVPEVRMAASPEAEIAAPAEAAKKTKQTQYGQWTVICPDAPGGELAKCVARLTIRDNTRNVTMIQWLASYNQDSTVLMEIITPTDVLIEPGLQLSIGDTLLQRHPYIFCVPAGCITRISPNAAMLKDLRSADVVKLAITTSAGKQVVFSIKVDGMTDGLNALAGL